LLLKFSFLALNAAFYSVLHVLTWAMLRYRLPVDAVLLIVAAVATAAVAIAEPLERWNVRTLERVNVSTCQRANVSTCKRANVST
jgi:hypothetical protein